MKSSKNKGWHICDNCNKLHKRYPGNEYKIRYGNKILHFCSYSCMNKIKSLIDCKDYDSVNSILKNIHDI